MADSTRFRGWYNRGYLPHFDTDQYPQMITYRLDDSLPSEVVERILQETPEGDYERRARFEELLDNGHGSCVLQTPKHAEIVAENLQYHDGKLYRLQDWVVMPNHAHVAYDRPTATMGKIVQGWKGYTANQIKKSLGTYGDGEPFWQAGYHDRYARDDRHFFNMQCYIFLNPVKAGLVDDPFDWPWSSIHRHERFRASIMRWWEEWKDRFWEFEEEWQE